jgi:SAM-dependent methyltransferase
MLNSPKASPWVRRFAPLAASGGAVLDIACGGGRHLRLFAEAGHPVTGIDRDLGGVADLSGRPGIDLVQADLEDGSPWPLPPERRFAAVIVTNYLHRPLLPLLAGLLVPDGVLIYETFAAGNERFGRPSSPAFLLEPGELLTTAARGLQVVAFEQGETETPKKAVVQRLCALSGDHPHPLSWPLPACSL